MFFPFVNTFFFLARARRNYCAAAIYLSNHVNAPMIPVMTLRDYLKSRGTAILHAAINAARTLAMTLRSVLENQNHKRERSSDGNVQTVHQHDSDCECCSHAEGDTQRSGSSSSFLDLWHRWRRCWSNRVRSFQTKHRKFVHQRYTAVCSWFGSISIGECDDKRRQRGRTVQRRIGGRRQSLHQLRRRRNRRNNAAVSSVRGVGLTGQAGQTGKDDNGGQRTKRSVLESAEKKTSAWRVQYEIPELVQAWALQETCAALRIRHSIPPVQ